MVRRASAPSTQIAASASSSRIHRSNDSHHGFIGTHPTNTGFSAYTAAGSTGSPHDKVVLSLIKRLTNKLPCYSGLSLVEIESDDAVLLVIESLTELARYALDIIVWKLSEELERLAKNTDASGLRALDILQSQLFLLKIMSVTMAYRWQCKRTDYERSAGAPEPPTASIRQFSNGIPIPTSPTPSLTSSQPHSKRRPGYASSEAFSNYSSTEAPPLDENCAKLLVSVMVLVLRQTSPRDERATWYANLNFDATLYGFESVDDAHIWVNPQPNRVQSELPARVATLTRKHPSLSSMNSPLTPIPIPKDSTSYKPTPRSLTTSSLPLHSLIGKWAGNILYLLSAGNWNVIFTRIRNKIHHFAQTSGGDENLDVVDLQLVQHCAMDRVRLVQIMQELSSLLLNMKPEAQAAAAVALRRAIWNWIEMFPVEYNEVICGARRLDGAPERLFDLLYQISETRNKNAIWPTLNLLMAISYERVSQIALTPGRAVNANKPNKKEVLFVDQMRKSLPITSKLSDVSLVCCIDFCRIAARAAPNPDVHLRSLASELCDDIKTRLSKSSGQRPFHDSTEEIDVALYGDALVAVFRFLPEEESGLIFNACLDPERSDAVKMCAIKACVILAGEEAQLPWQQPLDNLRARVGHRVRSIYKSAVLRRNEIDEYGNIKRALPRPNAKRFTSESIPDRDLLLLAILSLFRTDERFWLANCPVPEIQQWMCETVNVLTRPGDPSVPLSAVRTFIGSSQAILRLRPGSPLYEESTAGLGKAIPAAISCAASRLLDSRDNFDEQRMMVEMCLGLMAVYHISCLNESWNTWRFSVERIPAIALAELAFLVTLTSSDNGVSALAAKGLRTIAQVERVPEAPRNPGVSEDDRLRRYAIYEQLGDPKVTTVGRVGHQKRIRKLLRTLASPCAMHNAVWQECFWRWSALEESVIRRSLDGFSFDTTLNGHKPIGDRNMSPAEMLHQWQNLTLFLAAFGEACSSPDLDSRGLTAIIPASCLPDRFRILQDCDEIMKTYITSSVDFLVADSVNAREVAKDALGNELSSSLYPKLIRRLNDVIDDIMKTAKDTDSVVTQPEDEELFLVFFEQFVAVLKLVLDRIDSPSEVVLANIDLSQTLFSLAKFIDRLGSASALRLKIKFCAFCDSALARSHSSFGLCKDERIRNNLLHAIVEWVPPAQLLTASDDDDGLLRTQRDLATIRTIVNLLANLRLEPPDGTSADDGTHAISRRFSRYQTLLMITLARIRTSHVGETDSVHDAPGYSNRKTVSQRESEVTELVITGLVNMLNANLEIGMKHCLTLGYDQDAEKRGVFCQVVARVLRSGAEFDNATNQNMGVRRNRLCELVKGSDMTLALAICETCPPSENDILIPVMLNLFDSRLSLMALLKLAIEREVKTATSEVSLFRGNTMRTLLLCAFAKLHGYDYLRTVLKPLIDHMRNLPEGVNFELEPTKITKTMLEKNQETIRVVARAFLDIICSSASALPPMIREICSHISKTVAEVWPEAKFAALGAFIFLRFISPTMVTPDSVDIELPRDNMVIRKGLLIITKIIQNLANNIMFGKEINMMCFNDFLSENIVRITRFLSDVNKQPSVGLEEEPDEWLGGTFDESDAIVLHRFFEKNADRVGRELLSLSKPTKDSEMSAGGKKAWDTLCASLVEMGPPAGIPKPNPLTAKESKDYIEFMARCGDRNTDSVRELFCNVSASMDSPVFLLAFRAFDVEVLDFELLMYHIFKILASPPYDGKDFDVILDCTGFTATSEIPMQWFKFGVELIPACMRDRLRTAHVLNPNILIQRHFRKLYNVGAGMLFTGEMRAYTSVEELLQKVPGLLLTPLGHASSLEREPKEIFKDLTLRQAHLMKIHINLTVAQTHLRITSLKPQNIFPNFSCKCTEVVPMSEIDDIYNVSTGRDSNEFIIRRSRNGGTLYFSSSERDQIGKVIRAAKGRVRNSISSPSERFPRLSNVSATLLNIGMVNINNDNEALRTAAYDLLSAVCAHLRYEGNPIPSKGFIPARPCAYIVIFSQRLANFAPRLTVDFLVEVCGGLEKYSVSDRITSLQYISPWIKNLTLFCDPASKYYEHSGAKLRDCIRLLIDITMRDQEAFSIVQKYIWAEIAKLDSLFINVVLDEVMRAAVDGGIGSRRCEFMADTITSLASVNTRQRIISKLRKTLGKTSMKPTKSLADNVHWPEIAVYARLVLATDYNPRQTTCSQAFVPDIIHLVTLLAGLGETSVRVTVYSLTMNLLQSFCPLREDDESGQEIRTLINEFIQPETLALFGLSRVSPTSEYTSFDGPSEQITINSLEGLSALLLKAINTCAADSGLANIWQARWMSLLAATAFQLSLSIQPRAFIVLGTLTPSDFDDDLLYQMLVALKSAMKISDESDTMCVVSMLRCICKVVSALPENSRYLPHIFWLAVALLQSSHAPYYKEATGLLCASLKNLHKQGLLHEKGFSTTLLDAREPLEDISLQLDQLLGISFDTNFSFALASVLFKGIRRPQFRECAIESLRCLLQVSVQTTPRDTASSTVDSDSLGYFIALLPVSSTPSAYKALLDDAGIMNQEWYPQREGNEDRDDYVPRVPFEMLGCSDPNTALLLVSFISAMLSTAQGDDAESQILYTLLSDAAIVYPEMVSLTYDTLQDKIYDLFANSSNPSILFAVSSVFRASMEDPTRLIDGRGSASTLSTVDEGNVFGPGRKHILALEELNMQGIASSFQFLPPNRGHATKILNWFPELITRIIE